MPHPNRMPIQPADLQEETMGAHLPNIADRILLLALREEGEADEEGMTSRRAGGLVDASRRVSWDVSWEPRGDLLGRLGGLAKLAVQIQGRG